MAKKTVRLDDGQGNTLYPESAESERTNSNTGYRKCADGTLIQWGLCTTSVSSGLTEDVYFDFNIPFDSTPVVFLTLQASNPSNFQIATRNAETARGRLSIYNALSSTQTAYIRYLAIGRWKA